MSSAPPSRTPHPLKAQQVGVDSAEFREIAKWNYSENLFYLQQVNGMLQNEVPLLMLHQGCKFFVYRDPVVGSEVVGFGTIQVTTIYSHHAGQSRHCYIPVLSVKPGIRSFGYGQAIVEHLLIYAARYTRLSQVSDLVFLDVYVANQPAINLYQKKCHFVVMNPLNPIPDPDQNNELYYIMARRV